MYGLRRPKLFLLKQKDTRVKPGYDVNKPAVGWVAKPNTLK